jgi:hypothetical protein
MQVNPTLPWRTTRIRPCYLCVSGCRHLRVFFRDLRRGANDKGVLQTECSPACPFHPLGAVRVQLQRVGKLMAPFRVYTSRTHASVRPERQHRRVLSS